MRIKKVSETTPINAQVLDGYSSSTTDAYSCNYINSIVESGSNANGSWVKYIDGTMICTQSATGTNNSTQNAGASLFRSSSNITFSDFPQTFISTPVVTITLTSVRIPVLFLIVIVVLPVLTPVILPSLFIVAILLSLLS